jgi:hypothetical protein
MEEIQATRGYEPYVYHCHFVIYSFQTFLIFKMVKISPWVVVGLSQVRVDRPSENSASWFNIHPETMRAFYPTFLLFLP